MEIYKIAEKVAEKAVDVDKAAESVSKVAEKTIDMDILRFVENLKYMGLGMLGIIAVIGVIIIITMILSKLTAPKKSDNQQ